MACKCFHLVSGINASETAVVLTFSDTVTLDNEQCICFKYLTDIGSAYDSVPVYIYANAQNLPLWDKYGNPVTGSDLKKYRIYKGNYGSTTPHVLVRNVPMGL